MTSAYEEAGNLRQVINADPYEWQCSGESRTGIFVTVSIGVAIYGIHGIQREELLEKADLAMYQAKLAGRDCVCVADSHVSQPIGALDLRRRERVEGLLGDDAGQGQFSIQALQALNAVIHVCDAPTGAHS